MALSTKNCQQTHIIENICVASERALKMYIFFLVYIPYAHKKVSSNFVGAPFLWGPLGSCPLCPLLNPALEQTNKSSEKVPSLVNSGTIILMQNVLFSTIILQNYVIEHPFKEEIHTRISLILNEREKNSLQNSARMIKIG